MSAPTLLDPDVRFLTPALTASRETLVRAGVALWRVHASPSRVIGHLRALPTDRGVRYRAERLHLATGVFRLVGDFWSPDDAIAALRA